MTRNFRRILALTSVLLLAACASGTSERVREARDTTAYTQIGMWSYKGRHETTNYGVDHFIPINTQVRILDTGRRSIVFQVVDNGMKVELVNAEKYTNQNIDAIYDRYFSQTPVNLNRFSANERESIMRGDVRRGMSKEAVLLARGYPPAHETPSTDKDEWKYWKSRFDTIIVSFRNGRVSGITN